MSALPVGARPVYLTRAGDAFRLSFAYQPALVERARALPYAQYEPGSRVWTTPVCDQSVQALRAMFYDGLTDVAVDTLLHEGEQVAPVAPATLRERAGRRPFVVTIASRNDGTFEKLAAIPGAYWDKKSRSMSFPPLAAAALGQLVDRGILGDPQRLLTPAETIVAFDVQAGQFVVRAKDERAVKAFHRYFPAQDVMRAWRDKGLDVAFSDPFTEEVYRGELARVADLPALPALTTDLFDFQKRNVAIALQRTGFAIFDEPGLGKTIQAIAVGAAHLAAGNVPRVCVMVPSTVRTQWREEIIRFTGADPQDVIVVRGDPEARMKAYQAAQSASWFVVHYDILRRDQKLLAPLFAGALVVADEGQRLKSYRAERTKAAVALSASAARRLALSGTPMETNVSEWYQVLSGFAVPGVLGHPKDFNDRYRFPTKHGHEGARNLPELRQRSLAHFVRNTKAQVAPQLPALLVEQLVLDCEPAYAAALRRAHAEAVDEIEKMALAQYGARTSLTGGLFGGDEDDERKQSGAEMTAVGQLLRLCASPRLVHGSTADAAQALVGAGLVPLEDGPKLDELRIMAADFQSLAQMRRAATPDGHSPTPQEVQSERVVIFTAFKSMVDLIAERFTQDGIPFVTYTSATTQAQRDQAVATFTDPTTDVVAFIATDAAAEGLNLGRCCSTLVQFDPPWTPARALQRTNRIHRIDGTAARYRVVNLVLAGTLEHGVYRLLETRAEAQDALFNEAGSRQKVSGRKGRRQTVFEEAMSAFAQSGALTSKPARTRKAGKPPAPSGGALF